MTLSARLRPFLLILAPFLVVAALTRLSQPTDFDEGDYHIPVVREFAESLPQPDLLHYRSATTPLMHLALAAWGRIVGLDVWKLRLLVLLAGIGAALVFRQILLETGDAQANRNTLFLVVYPYFFWLSFLVMTEVVALLFGLLALRHALRPQTRRSDLIWFALWASLAVWTRQQWLFLPLAVGSYWLWRDRNLRRALWAAIPLITVAPLFVAWRGINPPIFFATSHDPVFNPTQLTLLLVFIGFYFAAPVLLARTPAVPWRRWWPLVLIVAAGALVLPHIDALPEAWALSALQRNFVGNLAQLGDLAATRLPPFVVLAGYLLLYLAGALALIKAWGLRADERSGLLWWLLAVFMVMAALVAQPWERYLLPLVPLLILLLYTPLTAQRRLLNVWLVVQALLLVGFLIYQLNGQISL